MSESASTRVSLNLLVRGGPASSLDDRRSVMRWLADEGVVCHDLGFGVACEIDGDAIERVFGAAANAAGEIPVPAALAPWVEEITVAIPPTLF